MLNCWDKFWDTIVEDSDDDFRHKDLTQMTYNICECIDLTNELQGYIYLQETALSKIQDVHQDQVPLSSFLSSAFSLLTLFSSDPKMVTISSRTACFSLWNSDKKEKSLFPILFYKCPRINSIGSDWLAWFGESSCLNPYIGNEDGMYWLAYGNGGWCLDGCQTNFTLLEN